MIFFIHIPKTAGTTFYEVVKKNHAQFIKLKPELVSNTNFTTINEDCAIRLSGGYSSAPQNLKSILTAKKNDHIKFIGGHVGYGFHEEIENDVTYISFIRDPKSRILSDYGEHCKPGRHFFDLLSANNFDINYYLELVLNDGLDNIMTRQIAGPYDFYLKNRTMVDDNLFAKACSNVNSITFFDFENFDEALIYLANEVKWNRLAYERKNVSKTRNTSPLNIDNNLLDKVIHYDLKLFNAIKVVNEKKMSKLENLLFKLKTW